MKYIHIMEEKQQVKILLILQNKEELGAEEIVINLIDNDGVMKGMIYH